MCKNVQLRDFKYSLAQVEIVLKESAIAIEKIEEILSCISNIDSSKKDTKK